MKIGISQNGSKDLVEYPINQVKRVLHREASNIRHYENLKFLLNCYETQDEAEKVLKLYYEGRSLSLPPIKLNLGGFDMNDPYVLAYGTTNFDVFSIYMMNLCSLLGIQKYLNQGNSYQDIKDNPDEVKKLIFNEREEWLPKPVKLWRNKVAAHYAAADPKKNDNLMTLMDSLSAVPHYSFPRYTVSSMRIVVNGETSQLKEWSVTKVYEELTTKLALKPLRPLLNTLLVGPNGEKDPLLTHS
ncbi:hypothetical protein [Shewanella algae]|uniref:hypothetical protein n=1 Tax=Shewanella algae TaxID=38313 RepID=UPI001AAD796F|nr:hypothetical protein [Shewanella algae]MBO2629479.1 hypothetical protein [Shewanella algae]QTE83641.1 hypothetical protein JKK46_07040 [Shewanella algae]